MEAEEHGVAGSAEWDETTPACGHPSGEGIGDASLVVRHVVMVVGFDRACGMG